MPRRVMHVRAFVIVLAALALALVVGACSRGSDLTKPKARAYELLGTYGPKVSGLIGQHGELTAQAAKLPESDGKAQVVKELDAAHATIAALKAALDGYGATIDKAGKDGGAKGIETAMAAFEKDMSDGLTLASGSLKSARETIAGLEAAANAPPPAADAGVPLDGGVPPADAGK